MPRRARATGDRRTGAAAGSAGVDRRVVNDERGLQRGVLGTGELDGDRSGAAAQRVAVLGVAGVVVEVGERRHRGAE